MTDYDKDCGLYQIYGHHPVYGNDVLLYIGQTCENSFSGRIKEHEKEWLFSLESKSIRIHVGRIHNAETMDEDEWRNVVDMAETLLIYSHWPVANTMGIESIDDEKYYKIHILNCGEYGDLLPEVSGERWIVRHSNL